MAMGDEVWAASPADPEVKYPWVAPASAREDRLAEAVTAVALAFAVSIGLVIAMLPVTVRATSVDLVRPAAQAPVAALSAPAR